MSDWLTQLLHPDLVTLSAGAVYGVLFTLVFVESGMLVGFLLPGDTVLFAAGLLAAEPRSPLSLAVLSIGSAVCAVLGDGVGYWTGRRFGRPWVERRAGRAAAHLPAAERFYARWGFGAVVVARFIPWVRTLTPIVAGVAGMRYRTFVLANVIGALLWTTGLVLLGYIAYSIPWVRYGAYGIAAASILVFIVVPLARHRSGRGRASASNDRKSA